MKRITNRTGTKKGPTYCIDDVTDSILRIWEKRRQRMSLSYLTGRDDDTHCLYLLVGENWNSKMFHDKSIVYVFTVKAPWVMIRRTSEGLHVEVVTWFNVQVSNHCMFAEPLKSEWSRTQFYKDTNKSLRYCLPLRQTLAQAHETEKHP